MSPIDDISDDEEPSDEDIEEFGEENDTDTTCCPRCGADIYDDASRCPHCGMDVVRGRDPAARTSAGITWPIWVLLAAAVAAAVLLSFI